MKGNEILLNSEPKGVFIEGIVSGTPKPGTIVQVKAATEPAGGRFTYEVYNKAADGKPGLPIVLLEDHLRGKTYADAYEDGDRCFLYVPALGEELNLLYANIAGTGDSFAIGDLMMIDDGTGKLVDDSSGDRTPFECLETVAAITADTLVHSRFIGG